jgi:tetratricopeptide (TPR) repeat protein
MNSHAVIEWKQAAVKALTGRDFQDAVRQLQKVIAVEPSAQVYNQLGAAHGALKQFDRAEDCFQQAVHTTGPPNPIGKCVNLRKMGRSAVAS